MRCLLFLTFCRYKTGLALTHLLCDKRMQSVRVHRSCRATLNRDEKNLAVIRRSFGSVPKRLQATRKPHVLSRRGPEPLRRCTAETASGVLCLLRRCPCLSVGNSLKRVCFFVCFCVFVLVLCVFVYGAAESKENNKRLGRAARKDYALHRRNQVASILP